MGPGVICRHGTGHIRGHITALTAGENRQTIGIEIATEKLIAQRVGKKGEKIQAVGVSRGGRTTKIHAIVDSKVARSASR